MRTLLLAGVLCGGSVAHAERSTTVDIGGMIGGAEHRTDGGTAMQPAGGPRLTLSFEHPPPALPPSKDTNVDVTLVPELTAAAVMDADRGEALIGVGARGELRISSREGLFGGNARMAFYVLGRALIVGEHTDPAGEFGLGEYVYLHGRLRLGGEVGLTFRKNDELMDTQHVIMASAYLGWAM